MVAFKVCYKVKEYGNEKYKRKPYSIMTSDSTDCIIHLGALKQELGQGRYYEKVIIDKIVLAKGEEE